MEIESRGRPDEERDSCMYVCTGNSGDVPRSGEDITSIYCLGVRE